MSRVQNNKNYAMGSHPPGIKSFDLKHQYTLFETQPGLELGSYIQPTHTIRERNSFSSTTTTASDETSTTSAGPITPVTSISSTHRPTFTPVDSYSFYPTPPRPPRSIYRKLPPKLTESLENLVLASPGGSPPSNLWDLAEMHEFKVDKPLPITPKGSIELAPGTSVVSHVIPRKVVPQRSLPSIRGLTSISSKKGATTRPSTAPIRHLATGTRSSYAESSASSATSHNLVTPAASVPRASTSVCSDQCSRFYETNWQLYNEVERADIAAAARKGKETRKEKKERKRAEEEAFDADSIPAMKNLHEAGNVEIIGEDGQAVRFGDLVREKKTIVVFIRHWFCPLCAQYMTSIISQVRPEALEEADVGLIIIGNGSGKMLPAYKNKAFKCPFPMYTDPSLSLYRALGLTRQTGNAGPDDEAGDYLVQTAFQSTMSTLKRATIMPLNNPGHFFQLGGEFIFEGSLNCSYAHRMTTTRDHAPIRDVCQEAGVRLHWLHYEPGEAPPPVHRGSFASMLDMDAFHGSDVTPPELDEQYSSIRASPDLRWKADRNDEIQRIRKLKKARRGGGYFKEGGEKFYTEDKEITVVESGDNETGDLEEVGRRLIGLGLE